MNVIHDISPQIAARVAGYGYLIIIVAAIFAEFFVRTYLVIPDDATATANNIIANPVLFRWGIVGYLLAAIFDTIVALALYIVLSPINKSLSLLAAWFRLIHAIILGFILYNLFNVLLLLGGVEYLSVFSQEQLNAQVMLFLNAFDYGWLIGLVFFGIHCFIIGYLIYKSDFIPKIFGVLLMIAAIGYLIDSFAHFLLIDYAAYADIFLLIVGLPAIIAELSFCIWLLWKGKNIRIA